MFQLKQIYKLFVLMSISLLFIGCGNDDSFPIEQSSVGLYPLAVKQIPYEESENSSLSGNILVKQFNDENNITLKVERINLDSENTTIASIQAPLYTDTIALNDNILVVIYAEYDSASDNFLPKFNTYKIEDNDTITQLGTTLINTEINGSLPWNIEVRKTFFKDDLLAISFSSLYNGFDLYSVMLYSKDDNNTFHYLQTLTSDNDETDETRFGYDSIDKSENFIVVSEICKVNIYTQDTNSSLFVPTDSYTFDENYCRLSLKMSQNHLFASSSLRGEDPQYRLFRLGSNGEIIKSEDISYLTRAPSLVIKNLAFIPNDTGFSVYTISDTNDSNSLVKSRDINLSYYPNVVIDGHDTFLTVNRYYNLYMDFFEDYPQDRLYILSDTNTTQYLDEGNIYPFYKIAASTIHEPITYSLSGDDSDYFEIVENAIVPKEALNYENPIDMDANNIYEITLNLRDRQGHEKSLDFHVHLENKDYVTKAVTYSDDHNTSSLFFGSPLYLRDGYLVVGSRIGLSLFDVRDDNLTQLATSKIDSIQDYIFIRSLAKINNTILSGFSSYDINDTISSAGGVGIYGYEDGNNTLNFKNMLLSPTPTENGLFGYKILVDNNTTLISEPGTYSTYHYQSTGKIYIYNSDENATFTLQQTLQDPDEEESNAFGTSMSMDGNYLIVGAPGSNAWAGKAYLYKKDANGSMQYLETLLPSGNDTVDFGKTVALSGSYFVISAYSGVNGIYNLYIYQINPSNDRVSLISILNNVLSDRSDSMTLVDNNIFIASYSNIKGYDRVQDVIQHYQIAEDGSVSLKETLVNHMTESATIVQSFYKIVGDEDSLVVGNIMTILDGVYAHGSVTLYKKDQ